MLQPTDSLSAPAVAERMAAEQVAAEQVAAEQVVAEQVAAEQVATEPAATEAPGSEHGVGSDAVRWAAYSSLLEEAVDQGATAIQRIQEEFTARPYDVLERLPPIEAPSRLVRSLHYAGLRTTYDVIRSVNRASGIAVRAGIAWMKGRQHQR
jgi:hypothetical protein